MQISLVMDTMPALSGLLLVLVSPAPVSKHRDHCYQFGDVYDMNVPLVQVAFIFYDKYHLNEFQMRAEWAQSIEDWEGGNQNFAVGHHMPATCMFFSLIACRGCLDRRTQILA